MDGELGDVTQPVNYKPLPGQRDLFNLDELETKTDEPKSEEPKETKTEQKSQKTLF